MASLRKISSRGRNGWLIRFYVGKQRKSISISDIEESEANLWLKHIENLAACHGKTAPSKATTNWVSILALDHRDKLEASGLIEPAVKTQKASTQLGDFLDAFLDARRGEIKPSTLATLQRTADRLIEYFKRTKKLEEIGPMDAKHFRKWLEGVNKRDKPKDEKGNPIQKNLALNTLRRRTGQCSQFFAQAVEDGLIDRNPFRGLPASVRSNKERQHYVPLDVFAKVLEKAPNARWRSLLVLARIGGVRMPSEVAGLRWKDIAWEARRLTVFSPKTEHHEGKDLRVIPLFPAIECELRKLMQDVEKGAEYVFPGLDGDSNLRTTLEKILRRAGVKQWPKLWQNLRASGSTDLARKLPGHVAAAICGHTEEIAKEHYWTVSDVDLDQALQSGLGEIIKIDEPCTNAACHSEPPIGQPIGAPTGAPIEGQFQAPWGNSTDGAKFPEDGFHQGNPTESTLMAAPGDSGQGKNNRRRGTLHNQGNTVSKQLWHHRRPIGRPNGQPQRRYSSDASHVHGRRPRTGRRDFPVVTYNLLKRGMLYHGKHRRG